MLGFQSLIILSTREQIIFNIYLLQYYIIQVWVSVEPETYLEVEVQYNDHLPVTWLEDGVLDVVVKNVHFITAD